MALPEVGLQAVIANLPGFEAGAKAITSAYDAIEKKASNVEKATNIMGGAFSSLTSPISNAASQFVSLGNSVIKFGAIAGGVALAGTAALGAGIVALGASALSEVAKFERMELSIQNLVAREIAGGKLIEQSRTGRIQLTEKESKELEKLKTNIDNEINDRTVLSARIEEQKEKIRQLTDQYGDQGLVVIKERAELQGMQLDLEDLNGEITTHQGRIDELTGKQGQLITTLEKVRVGQMNMTEAMELATPRAKELIQWIQLLAIQSPFTSEGIQAAFQTALAYGFTTEAAQRLTKAEVDFVAATGKSAQSADLIALALGQMQSRGKVTAQELRQLSEQGIGTNRILEDMGFNLDDVSNGLVDADTFIEAVIKDMEIFSGAALQQATTFSGLISSLQEIKSVALREFFTGTFEAIRPSLASFVDLLTKASIQTGDIGELGNVLGQKVGGALKEIQRIIATFQAGGLAVFSSFLGTQGIALWFELKELVSNVAMAFSNLAGVANSQLTPIFSQLSANIIPAITQALSFVNEHFEEFKGALLGVGAVLAAGVFAALVAGILSLLTPINLIIAGAALLGAAWVGNWGGIQEKTAAAWAAIQPVLIQIWEWLSKNIPLAIQFLNDTWTNLVIATQAVIDIWNNSLLPVITAVWAFIQTSIVPLLISVGNLMSAIVGKATQALAGLWQNVLLPALRKVWDFINKNIMPIFEAVGAVILEKVGPPMSNLSDKILPALTKGFEAVKKVIKDVTGFFEGLAQKVRNFKLPDILVRHSPSPFEQVLLGVAEAANLAAGGMDNLAQSVSSANFDKLLGIDRNLTDPLRIAGAAFDDLEKHLDKTIGKGKTGFALTNIKKAIKENISQILTSLNPTKTIDEIAAHAVPNWEKVGIKLQNVGDVFWKSFKENAKDAVATLQDMFIEAGRTAISIGQRLTGVIGGAVDLLNSRVERLQQIVAQGGGEFEGKVLSTVEAQNLLNQALQEQASIQDDILKTKEQEQKLNFLQQQLDLFDTIKEAGLDIGQVLGGLHLGLDASIPDLIAATNKVIEAMINQVNTDLGNISSVGAALGNALTGGVTGSLGIASPSKVMQGLADNTMSSFMNRMLSWGPAIAGAAGSAIAGPTMVAAPALASVGAGSQTTINANFGGNSISSGMDEAQFDSMVLRSIQRLMR